jgi:hypothetical protein
MITVQISSIDNTETILKSGYSLSIQLKKNFGIVWFLNSFETKDQIEISINKIIDNFELRHTKIFIIENKNESIDIFCERVESSFLFLQLQNTKSKSIQNSLKQCRNLRIPYILWKTNFEKLNLDQVIVPVGFLEEEVEKAQFASAFGRFSNSSIHLLLANDYGSKAMNNAAKMISLFDKFDFKHNQVKAKTDSFKIEFESIQFAYQVNGGIIIISASRDYGLDDLFFGPKEYHVIRKSDLPILLVNPRGDLYALCD